MRPDVPDLTPRKAGLHGQMQRQCEQECDGQRMHICEITAGRSLAFARIRLNSMGRETAGFGFMAPSSDNLVWIDLEMTGLDPATDHIIEIATIVTDAHLDVVAEGPVLAVHRDEAVLAAMDEWNRTTHGASGLIERVRRSRVTAATR